MVRWIQARAAVERCKEELVILPLEMERCVLGYGHRARLWQNRSEIPGLSLGHRCYALRKADVWGNLVAKAEHCFEKVLGPGVLFV